MKYFVNYLAFRYSSKLKNDKLNVNVTLKLLLIILRLSNAWFPFIWYNYITFTFECVISKINRLYVDIANIIGYHNLWLQGLILWSCSNNKYCGFQYKINHLEVPHWNIKLKINSINQSRVYLGQFFATLI